MSNVKNVGKVDFASATDAERAEALAHAEEIQAPEESPPAAPPALSTPRSYTLADLDADRNRALLSLADLPDGHGWGSELDRMVGGGLGPGDVVGLGASAAGAGKTALVMQLADGLALRSADLAETAKGGPLTPMLLLSEMDPKALARRTLARLAGAPAWFFRSGVAAERSRHRAEAATAYDKARALLQPGGAFQRLAAWQRTARPTNRGAAMLGQVEKAVEDFKAEVKARYPGRQVWPVVVIDPIQRWQSEGVSEVEALNALAESVDALADDHGWIVLLTSDTNKAAAVGREEKDRDPANLFRGSYKLFHACDLVLTSTAEPYVEGQAVREVTVGIAKNRNGGMGSVSFGWEGATGRFTPRPPAPRPAPAAASSPAKGGAYDHRL